MLLTFFDMSARTHYLNARQTLRRLIEWRVVPVINENDTTTTDDISFGDNDFLAAQVAILIGADRLVLLTDTDGLYTSDPRTDPAAQLLGEVTDFEALGRLEIGHSTSPLGSGGMRSKVVAAEMATAAGIPAVICNGLRPGALEAALAGAGERRDALPGAGGALLELQAVAALRQAVARHDRRRRGRGPGAARRRDVAAPGRHRRRPRRLRRGRRRACHRGRRRDRQGDHELLGARVAAGHGAEERAGARGAPAGDGRGRAP